MVSYGVESSIFSILLALFMHPVRDQEMTKAVYRLTAVRKWLVNRHRTICCKGLAVQITAIADPRDSSLVQCWKGVETIATATLDASEAAKLRRPTRIEHSARCLKPAIPRRVHATSAFRRLDIDKQARCIDTNADFKKAVKVEQGVIDQQGSAKITPPNAEKEGHSPI